MKAKFGAIVVDGRGKLGGHVFSKNRGGAYMRTKVTPVNPDTTFQAAARSRLTGWSQAWRDLTQIQRNAWNAAVSDFSRTNVFGDIKNPSGFNLYQRLNNNIQIGAGVALTEPPLVGDVPAITSFSFSANDNQAMIITFAPTPVPANTYFKVFATAPQSPGKNFVKSEYRMIDTLAAAVATGADIGEAYQGRFGPVVAGQKVFVKLVPVNLLTGQEGIGVSDSQLVEVAP